MLLRRHRIDGVGRMRPAPKSVQKPIEKPIEEKIEEKVEEVKPAFTKTEIMRMDKETLVNEATKIGIENADKLSGNELKKRLVEHYL